MSKIQELKDLIIKYDASYRKGLSLVTDSVYDGLIEELVSLVGEEDDFFNSSIKSNDVTDRREQIPIVMASMNKAKTIGELSNWMRLKGIPLTTELILSPKYDGISLCKEESTGKAWTRGSKDNSGGLRSDAHLKFMKDVTLKSEFTFGECIISRENFQKIKDSFNGDSPRNAVAGIFRRDYTSDELEVVDFIRYGTVGKVFKTKAEMLDFLNESQKVSVPYKIKKLIDISEDYLQNLFKEFTSTYEIDGLILEINDISLWDKLGRERSGNPKWAIAYKGNFEQIGETVCINIENSISKEGNIIPVAVLEPIKLDGATVSRVTLNNYTFMKEMGIGIGSRVKVKRSGMVIPLITEVINKTDFKLPDIESYWEGVHLKTSYETGAQKKKKLFAFFQILGVENVSDKTFDLLFDSGYVSVKQILSMSREEFLKLERFGERKAEIVFEAIQSKMNQVALSKLQHATGFFKQLGSKKLLLLEHFITKPTLAKVMEIDGFSETLATNYLSGWDPFWEFVKDIEQFITIKKEEKIEMENDTMKGMIFVFTGFRDEAAEIEIQKRGGIIGSGVSRITTHLVVKDKESTSSKMQKATEYGAKILDIEDFFNTFGLQLAIKQRGKK